MSQPFDPATKNEVETFVTEVERFQKGELDENVFKRFRLLHGTYTQRQPGVYMMRIKVPYGVINIEQLRTLADVIEKYVPKDFGHITTRQAVQCYYIELPNTAKAFRELNDVGLTTRESAGNVVRNITGCEFAGACKEEIFDYRPYAELVREYFFRNPVALDLPRKFKIAFSGCARDCAMGYANDLGFVAKVQDGKKGFRILVGGGLGTKAYAGKVLHEFLPVEEILNCTQAVIAVFGRHGNRNNIFRARLKYLIEDIGFEGFWKLYETEFKALSEDAERGKALPQPETPPSPPFAKGGGRMEPS